MTTLPWLGEVPAHWTVVRLKRCFNIVGGSTPQSDVEEYWNGEIPWATPTDLSADGAMPLRETLRTITVAGLESCGTTMVPAGSLILSTRAPIGSLAIAEVAMCTNQGCKSLVSFGHENTDYYGYVLQSAKDELNIRGKGTTFLELSSDALGAFEVPLPPLAEQQAIAAYLDGETARIDGLVDDQRRLIELLRERRAAVIAHAVTKGLDPAAPLRPSGVAWLGEVPGHWGVVRNKVVFSEIDERSQEISEAAELLTVSHITGVTPRAEKEVNMFLAENFDGYKVCRSGDLVINTMWAWMGALGCARQLGIVSPSYNVYRLRESSSVNADYYDFLCRIPAHRTAMKAESTGVWESRLRLYPDAFLAMQMPLPPLAEQQAIAAYLDGETARIDGLIADAERGIALLQERRAAVISAAVRGDLTPGPSPFVGSPH